MQWDPEMYIVFEKVHFKEKNLHFHGSTMTRSSIYCQPVSVDIVVLFIVILACICRSVESWCIPVDPETTFSYQRAFF